jgi:hypothetical protein
MFSKDRTHYRATPRTLNEAFGPYHSIDVQYRRVRKDVLGAAFGVVALGIVYGLLIGWRG